MSSMEATGAKVEWSIDPQKILDTVIDTCPKIEYIARPGQEASVITLHRANGEITSCTVMSLSTIPRSFDLSRLKVTPVVKLSIGGNPLTTRTRYFFRIPGRPDQPWSRQVWEAWADHLKPFDGQVDTVFTTQSGCPPVMDLIDLLGRRRPDSTGRLRLDMGKQPGMGSPDLTDLLRAADGKIREIYFSDSRETVWLPWTYTLQAIFDASLRNITYLRIPVEPEIGSVRERLSYDGLTWIDSPYHTSMRTLHLHFASSQSQQEHINIPLLAESLLAVAGPLCEYLITRNGQGDLQSKVQEEIDRIIWMKREAQERGWSRLESM